MRNLSCPSADDLKAFVLGELPEVRCDPLCAHLENCPRCEALTQELDQLDDPIMHAIRQGESLTYDMTSHDAGDTPREGALPGGPMSLPECVAGYTILAELGRGGM